MTRARNLADLGDDATGLATDAELSSGLASKLPYSYGTATPSTSDDGFLWYDSNSTPPDVKFWDGAAFQALTSGKILQIVRATDSTNRSTTSTSLVDVTGMSVTITPTKSTSAIIIVAAFNIETLYAGGVVDQTAFVSITDSSNNAISGAQQVRFGNTENSGGSNVRLLSYLTLLAYATPATTSATTYKLRFSVSSATTTVSILNGSWTAGQMYAIEVAA